jgi:hypothetical protein
MPRHDLPDPELAAVLAAIVGDEHRFGHRQHIHLAYEAIRRYGMPEAADRVCGWIRQLAAYQRAPQKYHHTVSRAWMELVAFHVTHSAPGLGFDALLADFPDLLDKRLLSRHYRSTTLASATAHQTWIEPDLQPLPGNSERQASF